MAGEPGSNGTVAVAPPYAPIGPSSGETPTMLFELGAAKPLPGSSPMRLLTADTSPTTSGPRSVVSRCVFPVTIVFVSRTTADAEHPEAMPPPRLAELPTKVLLTTGESPTTQLEIAP